MQSVPENNKIRFGFRYQLLNSRCKKAEQNCAPDCSILLRFFHFLSRSQKPLLHFCGARGKMNTGKKHFNLTRGNAVAGTWKVSQITDLVFSGSTFSPSLNPIFHAEIVEIRRDQQDFVGFQNNSLAFCELYEKNGLTIICTSVPAQTILSPFSFTIDYMIFDRSRRLYTSVRTSMTFPITT